jgi:phage portal protein BeeE
VSADLQLLQHRRFSLAEICAAFGVPEEIVTTINAAKYDIMRGARLSFVENSVVPLCRRLEAGEHQVVQAIAPGWTGYFESDEHPVMAAARRERLKVAETGFRMGIPLNDLNRVYDLGFPDYPWGNSGYIASGLQAVGKAGNKVES